MLLLLNCAPDLFDPHHHDITAAGLLGDKLSYLPGVHQEPLYEQGPDNGAHFFNKLWPKVFGHISLSTKCVY